MAWDYAELSKAAKTAGGPEKLVNQIEETAKSIGRIEGKTSMIPLMGFGAIGVSVITAGVIKLVDHIKAKKAISQAAVDEAKAEIIQGIKDYDATHISDADVENTTEEKESNEN